MLTQLQRGVAAPKAVEKQQTGVRCSKASAYVVALQLYGSPRVEVTPFQVGSFALFRVCEQVPSGRPVAVPSPAPCQQVSTSSPVACRVASAPKPTVSALAAASQKAMPQGNGCKQQQIINLGSKYVVLHVKEASGLRLEE